ncbi:MAG: DNA-binding domain-containing protein, partial [Bryobacteraceae bacterium]
ELAALQKWMQGALIAEQPVSPAAVRRRVRPSRTLAPSQRLDIYRDMYEARLIEALRADYPLLAQALGGELFEDLLHLYLREHPSRSYTLNRLGDHLPGFLPDVEGLPNPDFLHDLARYELATTLVFDEEQVPPLDAARFAEVPTDAWPEARLITVPALRLLALQYPAHRWKGKALHRRKSWIAVVRRDYAVNWMELTQPGYKLLAGLIAGRTLGEAIGRRSPAMLAEWFREWASAGIFASVELGR